MWKINTKSDFSPLNLGIGQNTKERDSRRQFPKSMQKEIWDRQNGRCVGSHCNHSRLRASAVHYDHIKPHKTGGKTILSNGQALCPTCHSFKTNKETIKTLRGKRKNNHNPALGLAMPKSDFKHLFFGKK
ncbi:MAG TPA: HNH endonuclease [Candidatus Nanoarchaeia archaeon]|nr:HNH endonuclease [Candidatus Nanoarchaeia archaeon]